MVDLRAITVRQPWAQAIVDGHKPIENRSSGFAKRYRGLLLIHTSKSWSVRGQRDPRVRSAYGLTNRVDAATFDAMPRGAVIGLVDVVHIHLGAHCCDPWGEDLYRDHRDRVVATTHLVLERHIKLPRPIEARGALGLWCPDDDLRLEVAHALAELVTWDPAGAATVADQADIHQLHHLLTEAAA